MNWISEIQAAAEADLKSAICIVVTAKGSTPGKVGSKMIVYADGTIRGTIGGGNLEKKVIENALLSISHNAPEMFRHDLLHEHGMCCGGMVEVFIEPIQKTKHLYIFGAGHIGQAIAKIAPTLEFETFVIDDRASYLSMVQDEGVTKWNLNHREAFDKIKFNENTYILIMTYDHSYDREILAYCIGKPHGYLGMIGSKRKITVTKKMFAVAQQASPEQLAKVDMPMGLDINAEAPEEIAVSILAKLIQLRNQGKTRKRKSEQIDVEECLSIVNLNPNNK